MGQRDSFSKVTESLSFTIFSCQCCTQTNAAKARSGEGTNEGIAKSKSRVHD